MRLNKKGLTLQEGLNAVIIVGLIGLFLGFFALFNDEFKDVANYDSQITRNESTFINVTGDTLNGASANGFRNAIAVVAINGSSGLVINSGNYTLNTTTGVLKNSSVSSIVWANVNFSYTFDTYSSAQNLTQSLNDEYENQTSILGLVLLAVFFGIAISALIGSFVMNMFRSRV